MSPAYRFVVSIVRAVLRLFFREVEITGLENLPTDRGGVLVAWHPNGLIDPGLILACSPRPVVFGARDGLFRVPLLGWMMRAVGTVPIYRPQDGAAADPEARKTANARSLDALAGRVAAGQFSCLFPEGTSHDAPHLLQLRTGAARFWYRSRELLGVDAEPPVIIPVGLHYDEKRGFRSRVLVAFHPPLEVPDDLRPMPAPDEERPRLQGLTGEIERVLHDVVRATENWELHHLMHRARKLVRAERARRAGADPGRPGLGEKQLGFARVWQGYYQRRASHPEVVAGLLARVREYDADLRVLGMEDHELDRPPRLFRWHLAAVLVFQVLGVFVFLPPLLVVGVLVNAVPFFALGAVVRSVSKQHKDEATLKLMLGALLFPAVWGLVGVAAFFGADALHTFYPSLPHQPGAAAFWVVALSIVGGVAALRYLRITRETARALRVRLTRARRGSTLAHLKLERSWLHDRITEMADGLDLPGEVAPSGKIVGP